MRALEHRLRYTRRLQNIVLRSSVTQTLRCGLPITAAHPANLTTNQAKGMELTAHHVLCR